MKRFSIFTIMFVFALSFMVFGCSSDDKTLKITPSKLDFGSVNLGDTFDIEVTLKNKYGKDVTITNLDISGSADFIITSGGTIPFNLINNDEHKFTIMFKPSVGGQITATLFITHDASSKTKDVEMKGVGVPVARIDLSDTTFDFDKRLINRMHTHDLDIENVGTADLDINNLSFVGLGAAVYNISAGGPAPINITPGTTKTITIAFNPIVVGNYACNLEVYHNGVNENSPLIYPVTGEAIDVDPQITLSRTSPWDLGSVAKTIPSTQICEIENTGIDPLTVTSATLATGTIITIDSLKDSNGNVINFPQVIAVAAKIMLAIKFSPTANTTYNDTLTLIHDGTNEVSPLDVALAGEGRDEISKTYTYSGAPVNWVVPAGVSVIIGEVWGAQGAGSIGGKGARMKGTFAVTPGDTLEIFAGYQRGTYGGGDGSYIAKGNTIYIIGGGGGGSYSTSRNGADAPTTTSGTISPNHAGGAGGTNGQGGVAGTGDWGTGGGGGWLSAGGSGIGTAGGAIKGRSADGRTYAGGGGGGYSGGGGVDMWSGAGTGGGGAGGSYNDGTNQSNTAGTRTGNGEVKIIY